jgi:hypothetical protein
MMVMEKSIGLTKDAGYQIGVRRTIQTLHAPAWELVFSTQGLELWLGPSTDLDLKEGQSYKLRDGTSGQVRVFKPGSHARITWHPPEYDRASTIQVRVIEKGDKTVIAFHQEHLPDSEARDNRRAHFKRALDVLETILSN